MRLNNPCIRSSSSTSRIRLFQPSGLQFIRHVLSHTPDDRSSNNSHLGPTLTWGTYKPGQAREGLAFLSGGTLPACRRAFKQTLGGRRPTEWIDPPPRLLIVYRSFTPPALGCSPADVQHGDWAGSKSEDETRRMLKNVESWFNPALSFHLYQSSADGRVSGRSRLRRSRGRKSNCPLA